MSKQRVYYNKVAIAFVQALQKIKILIAGRGFGKTTLIAWVIYNMLREMGWKKRKDGSIRKAARIYFASTTVEQIHNELFPPIKQKWLEFGLKEGVHYVIGKRPPSWYKEPYSKPEKFENVVTFWNGFTINLLSTAKSKSKRGGSYDAGILDEAAFVKKSQFHAVFMPMIRGNLYKFVSRWHHSLTMITSRPKKPEGYWLYDYEKIAEEKPDRFLYVEASAEANKDVLGEDWFQDQLDILGADEYDIEIRNKKRSQLPTGFYHTLSRERNTYRLRKSESDRRTNELLEVSFDFGGKINCATVWQEQANIERCLSEFWVKREGKIEALVDKICSHYSSHQLKFIRIYGDPRGWDRDPGRPALYTIVAARFAHHGWDVEVVVQPGERTAAHKARYLFMSKALEGSPYLPSVLFNENSCADTLTAMQMCDIRDDFQKVKDAEKDEMFPQQHAPHLTDTIDYYLYTKHSWKLDMDGNHRSSGVW